MGLRSIEIVVCLIALLAIGQTAVVPTEETFVVTKTEGPVTVADIQNSETTTSEPSPEIKLIEMDVRSDIYMRYAHTAVVTHMRNPAIYAQEASFRVLLPESAFISGFTMILAGKEYKAYVKEKKEAKEIFSNAVSQGFGAAHIATKARDSNHFTVSVNVEPKSTAIFNLTYEELLIRRNNVYNHAINLHPGALVPKLKVTVDIKESQKITTLRVPEVRSGNEIDASENDAQNSKAVIERNSKDDHKAIITFNPDLEEQTRLRDVYAAKSKESQQGVQDGVLGQFVVQYDVDRTNDDEFLVNDGYFVHFFAPSNLPRLNKYIIFVLDTSGSMSWQNKILKLQEAMNIIISELNSNDYFSIVEFNSMVKVHNLNEASNPAAAHEYHVYNDDKTLVAPVLATSENIAKAKTIIGRLYASGGTEIKSALDLAMDLVQHTWPETSTAASLAPSSDATIENKHTDNDDNEILDMNYLEPIIFFLTDGQAYDGNSIIKHITERNSAVERKASIFSLAFGEDAKRDFLRQLSLRNDGLMRHIYVAADTALQLRDFYRQLSMPVLSGVHFVYPPEQIAEGSLTKHAYRSYYSGSEIIVAGRIANASDLTPSVRGRCSVSSNKKLYEKISVRQTPNSYLPLERLWAYLTIKQMLDKHDTADTTVKGDDPEKRALDLALKYNFVTRLTSLVVVKPNATTAVDAESVDKEKTNFNTGTIPTFQNSGASSFSRPLIMRSGHRVYPASSSRGRGGGGYASHSWSHSSLSSSHRADRIRTSSIYGGGGVPYSSAAGFSSNSRPAPKIMNSSIFGGGGAPYSSAADFSMKASSDESEAKNTSILKQFHLEQCNWLNNILVNGTDMIRFKVSETFTEMRLSRNTIPPSETGGDTNCTNPVRHNGENRTGNGLCVYLTRCDSSKAINETIYTQHFCIVNNAYAGVCCQRIDVTESIESNDSTD